MPAACKYQRLRCCALSLAAAPEAVPSQPPRNTSPPSLFFFNTSPLSQPPLFTFAIPSSTVQDGSSHTPKSKSHTNHFLPRRRQPSFRPTCDAVPCRPVTEQAGQALPPTMEKSRRTLRGSQLQAWHENDALLTYSFRHAVSSRHSLYVLHQQTIRHARIAVTATLCTDKGSWALRHTLSHTKPQNFEIVHLVKT
jgi:hypothetical protein